jgi:periplasmic protein CpxP/Spy
MTATQTLSKNLGRVLLTGLLAASCAAAIAQTPPPAPMPPPTGMRAPDAMRDGGNGPMGGAHPMGHMDPAKMQAMMAKRQAEMKAKLKITSAQEPAWTAFTSAMQPPAGGMGWRQSPEQRAELAKLSTPERIDKMRALRTQRMAEMNAMADKRDDATKTFYAVLSPEQKAVFDAEHAKRGHHGMRHGGGHNKG